MKTKLKMRIDQLKGNAHVLRALEVFAVAQPAAPGLLLIGEPRSEAFVLPHCDGFPAINAEARRPCPCGHFGSLHEECACDPESPEFRIHRAPFQFYAGAVEVVRPAFREITATHKPDRDTAYARIVAAREAFPTIPEDLDRETCALLEQAYDTLGFQPRDVRHVLSVARAVAALDASERLEAAHVLEAIQYKALALKLSSPIG